MSIELACEVEALVVKVYSDSQLLVVQENRQYEVIK